MLHNPQCDRDCCCVMTLVTGIAYPLLVTGIAQLLFPRAANGSLIERDGKPVGSEADRPAVLRSEILLGPPVGDGAVRRQRAASSGSNLGPTNPRARRRGQAAHRRAARGRSRQHGAGAGRSRHGVGQRPRSAHLAGGGGVSGRPRRARARHRRDATCEKLVAGATEGRTFGVLGEPRVNVLELNLALDGK